MIDIKIDKIKDLLKDPNMREYFIGGGIVFLAFIYFILAVLPAFSGFMKVSIEAGELSRKVQSAERIISRVDARIEKSKGLKEELGKHSKQLPAQKDITALLDGFSSIAGETNVKILSITPYDLKVMQTEGKEDKYYREMPIQITAKSGYHQLGDFVSSLEQGNRVIVIDDIKIWSDKNTPRLHNVNMMLKTYVSMENEKN